MLDFLIAVIVAFFFYLTVLPLIGIIGSILVRIILPYLLGSALVFGLLLQLTPALPLSWLGGSALIIWCVPALTIRCWPRHIKHQLGWQQGHFRACFALLTLGLCSRHDKQNRGDYPLKASLPAE